MTLRFARSWSAHAGTALLEVLLALALFVVAAAIVTSGMSASTDNLDRQRRNTHAANLAATVLAEIQLGIRSTTEAGEQPFTVPFDKWTAELVVTPTETEAGAASGLLRVEVIIRHQESALVRRLAQIIRVPSGVDTLVHSSSPEPTADKSVRLTRTAAY